MKKDSQLELIIKELEETVLILQEQDHFDDPVCISYLVGKFYAMSKLIFYFYCSEKEWEEFKEKFNIPPFIDNKNYKVHCLIIFSKWPKIKQYLSFNLKVKKTLDL